MKRLLFYLFIFMIALSLFAEEEEEDILRGLKVKKYPFYIYKDAFHRANHYCPSGWMGDYGDIRIKENWKKNPKEGKSCFKIIYNAKRAQNAGWAGIYWQNPPNNWGTVKGGYDLSKAKKLFFYARGEKGGELVEFKMGGITGKYSDTGMATTGPVELTKEWKLYEIDLTDIELSYISGGFCVVFSAQMDPDGCAFYIDEVYYTDKDRPLSSKKKSRKKKRK